MHNVIEQRPMVWKWYLAIGPQTLHARCGWCWQSIDVGQTNALSWNEGKVDTTSETVVVCSHMRYGVACIYSEPTWYRAERDTIYLR